MVKINAKSYGDDETYMLDLLYEWERSAAEYSEDIVQAALMVLLCQRLGSRNVTVAELLGGIVQFKDGDGLDAMVAARKGTDFATWNKYIHECGVCGRTTPNAHHKCICETETEEEATTRMIAEEAAKMERIRKHAAEIRAEEAQKRQQGAV